MPTWDARRSYEGNLSATANDDGTGSADVTEHWTVTSDTPTNTVIVKLFAPIPSKGNIHPDHGFLRVSNVDVDQASPIFFNVRVSYTVATEIGEDNPLDEPAKVSISSISSTEEIDEDIHGKPIQTVNGEPLTGVTEVIPDLTITVQRNLPSFDPFSIYTYKNKVNSDSFLGFPPGTLKITDIKANNVFTDQFEYWAASVTFQAREPIRTTAEKAWWKRVKHQGLKVKADAADDDAQPARDPTTNEPETSPVMIKPDGTRETDTTIGHWKEFETVGKVAFAGLNLLA